MNKEAQVMFEKVKAHGGLVVSSPEELAGYYRAGRIQGDLLEYIKTDVAKYGYTLCTNHSSINGENVWYFSPEALNVCYCGKPNELAMVVCKEHAKKTIEQRKKFKKLV